MAAKGKQAQPSLEQILQILQDNLLYLRDEYSVKSLGVFGSYVRRENKLRSDLDLLVEFEGAPTKFGFIRLQEH